MTPVLAAVFDLSPQSPVIEFWQNSGPFDVHARANWTSEPRSN